jgi:hypothetical protein
MYKSVTFKQVVCLFTGMAPSPSSSLNTPGPAVPTPSPCSLQDDQAYREKVRQLSKYIEPLRRMINRIGNDGVWILIYLYIVGFSLIADQLFYFPSIG